MGVGSGSEASGGAREGARRRISLVTTAAPAEGGGHLSRAVTLAEVLSRAGADVALRLLRGSPTAAQRARLAALDVGLETGGPNLAEPSDIVVVDLPDPAEVASALDARHLVVFDDSDLLRAPAAIVVQPSQPEWRGAAQAGRVLAGYQWAPIRSSILAAAAARGASPGEGVVVCFGGSDPWDVGARIVPAVAAGLGDAGAGADGRSAQPTVIVGAVYRGALGEAPGWRLLRDPADIDEHLARARLALIGAGTMKFELAALGVPTVTLAVADDQLPVGPAFARTGASVYAGDGRTVEPSLVAGTLVGLLGDEPALRAMRDAARRAVDGLGAERLAAEILELADEA